MRYSFTKRPAKVAAAASTDASRPALTAAWLDTSAGELRATDSYIAVRMPVEIDEGDADGWITAEALERSRKRAGGGIAANGTAAVYDLPAGGGTLSPEGIAQSTVASFPRPDLGTPPNFGQLWPADRDGFTVGLNAGFLKRLADALGATDGVVRLTFQSDANDKPNPLRAILVTVAGTCGERHDGLAGLDSPEGLIMPVRV